MQASKQARSVTLVTTACWLCVATFAFLQTGVASSVAQASSIYDKKISGIEGYNSNEEIPVTTEASARESLLYFRSGQTLFLDVDSLSLKSTLVVSASNVKVHGRDSGTILKCPLKGAAFYFTGFAVEVENLSFQECNHGYSAIKFLSYRMEAADTSVLKNCAFQQNGATSSEVNGGAIHCQTASLAIESTKFIDNAVTGKGGAIYSNACRMKISNSEFLRNSASELGGSLCAIYSNIEIDGSTFKDGLASGGGAILTDKSTTTTIRDSKFLNNVGTEVTGGVYDQFGSLTIINSFFQSNSVVESGNSISYEANEARDGMMENSARITIDSKFAVDLEATGRTTNNRFIGDTLAAESNVEENSYKYRGGAVYGHFSKVSIQSTKFSNNTAKMGGAFFSENTEVTISNSTFSKSKSKYYGGAAYFITGGVTIEHSIFEYNYASADGGGIKTEGCTLHIEDSNFVGNESPYGGGAYVYESFTTILDTKFTSNKAGKNGGAVNFNGCISASVSRSQFDGNSCDGAAGAVCIWKSKVGVKNSAFTENTGNNGGGVFAMNSTCEATDLSFVSNSAVRGGAFLVQGGSMNMQDLNIKSCSASVHGGGVFSTGAKLEMHHCSFEQNTAEYGGASSMYEGTASVQDTTFSSNSATKYGGAMYLNKQTTTADKSKFLHNSAKIAGRAITLYASNMTIRGSVFQDDSQSGGSYVVYSAGDSTCSITCSGSIDAYQCSVTSYTELLA